MVLKTSTKTPVGDTAKARKSRGTVLHRRPYFASRRYRVEIVNENTLERTFSIGLRGSKVILAAVGVVAAIASLIAMIFLFTPLAKFLPGHLKGDLRLQYAETAMRVDSLERSARVNAAYVDNLVDILSDKVKPTEVHSLVNDKDVVVDSLMAASETEQRFVKQFEEQDRFNRSVLSPIAAEGMLFESPSETDTGAGPAMAVYRGTVVASYTDADGLSTIVVQHPNDFISVMGNLSEVYVVSGQKVVAGQRIGSSMPQSPLTFELWHGGSRLDPALYIDY